MNHEVVFKFTHLLFNLLGYESLNITQKTPTSSMINYPTYWHRQVDLKSVSTGTINQTNTLLSSCDNTGPAKELILKGF